MFKKVRTTVDANGTVDVPGQPLARMDAAEVEADMAKTRRDLRQMAMTYGRIDTVEQTMTSLVIIYTSGTVVIYQWIAE